MQTRQCLARSVPTMTEPRHSEPLGDLKPTDRRLSYTGAAGLLHRCTVPGCIDRRPWIENPRNFGYLSPETAERRLNALTGISATSALKRLSEARKPELTK